MKNFVKTATVIAAILMFFVTSPVYAKAIHFVYYPTYAPFGWDDNGTMKGIYIDVLNVVLVEKMGLEVKHEALPWKRAQIMVERGKADGLVTAATPARLEYSDKPEETVVEANFKIYTSADCPNLKALKKVKSIPELKPFKLVDIRGSGWAKANLESAGLNVHWLDSTEQIFQFIIKNRADANINNEWITRDQLKKRKLLGKIIELPTPMTAQPIKFHMLISKKSAYHKYLPEMNKYLKEIKADGTHAKILAKWK